MEMKIKITGKPLVLNTLDNLQPNKKVWLSHESLLFTKTNDFYIYKKAQFVGRASPDNGYIVPVELDEEGYLNVCFKEIRFAFNMSDDKELKDVDINEYLHLSNVEMEKQKDDRDWIRRSMIDDLFQSFSLCLLNDLCPMENLLCIHETLLDRIVSCEDKDLLEDLVEFCSRNFKEESLIASSDEQAEALEQNLELLTAKLHKRVDEVQNLLDSLKVVATERVALLPQEETEESMQKDLDTAIAQEDYNKAVDIRNNMLGKGFKPNS